MPDSVGQGSGVVGATQVTYAAPLGAMRWRSSPALVATSTRQEAVFVPEEQERGTPGGVRRVPVPADLPPPTGQPSAAPPPAADSGGMRQPEQAPVEDALTVEEQAVVDHANNAVPDRSTADLWAFRLDSSVRAQEALLASMRLVARKHLELEDAAIVTKVRGRVRITQTKNVSPGQGAMGGAWIGVLAGLFFGPGGPLIGGALGAAAGGLFAKLRDLGIDDDEMRRMGDELAEGEAALFLLVEDCHRARALHEVSRFPGRLLASTADADLAREVRDRLATDPWDLA